MKLDHPMTLAAEIARLIESDPVAAAQVKEYLSEDRLREILGLSDIPTLLDVPEEDLEVFITDNYTRAHVLAWFP